MIGKALFPWPFLDEPLRASARSAIAKDLRALLDWQRTLQGFPKLCAPALEATPFVSLYARGALRGCFGNAEASKKQRIARAFLRAMHDDQRFDPIVDDDRRDLVAQVSYLLAPRRVEVDEAARTIEPGVHGVAVVHATARTLILPHVARMRGLDADRLLDALSKKAKLARASLSEGALFVFEIDDVIVRDDEVRAIDPLDGAAAWLARLVDGRGHVAFSIDAGAKTTRFTGEFHHGRAAVVIAALHAHGGHGRVVERARTRLKRDVEQALAGEALEGWPPDLVHVSGTLALAVIAGVDVAPSLLALVASSSAQHALASSPWHAAQVVHALGADAPRALYQACVADLEKTPWAPWTAIAARTLGDEPTFARAAQPLLRSIADGPPMAGGVRPSGKTIAEVALTAIVVEALHPFDERARAEPAELTKAREFLRRMQLLPERVPAHQSPSLAAYAFPASPVNDLLRGDVTAHALLALLPRAATSSAKVRPPNPSSRRPSSSRRSP